jgi:geranylgeranyl transferase type-1 subunit beta
MGKLNEVLGDEKIERLKQWCLNRQTTGFSGRVNKPWDTCYSFWIGSTLTVTKNIYLKYTRINYI